jgi:ferredoxin
MEVEVKFEREEISGVVPVGSYLFDAARRMGIEVECERRGESDLCAMRVKEGGELLSEVTKAEKEHLTSKRRKNGERLACQAKFEQTGEVVIMTTKKKEEEKPADEEKYETYRKEFEELPLEKKVANLLELEAITFSETISFVLNSPSMIVGKVMDVMAQFGLKIEDDAKKATRPNEHQSNGKSEQNGHSENGEASQTNDEANGETKNSETK